MHNKYTTGCAHALQQVTDKTGTTSITEPCPACGAHDDVITSNGLPPHHIDYSCQCSKCNFEWQPNRQESM